MKKTLLTIIILSLFITACSKAPEKKVEHQNILPQIENADPNGTLVLALSGEPTFFNPLLYTDSESGKVVDLVFNGLVKVDEKLEIIPDLAESWKASKDGKVWAFYLKKGIKFHDGRELTAEDVVFTFNKILDIKTNTVRRSDYIINGKPIKFSASDKYTVKAVLPEPFAPFLVRMSMGILPKHLFEKEDINKSKYNQNPVGTGPFIFVRYKTADHVKLERNENYFGRIPLLKEIFFKIIMDSNVQLIALRKGEIDMAGIQPKDLEMMETENRVNIFKYDRMLYSYFGFNCQKAPFDNVNVRRAIAYAIDKKALIETVTKGLASPAYSPTHPISWAYNPEVEKYEYNPAKAKEVLISQGWGLVDGKMVKDGQPLTFHVYIAKGSKASEKTVTMIQFFLKQIGVGLEIRILEWSSLLKIVNAVEGPKAFDSIMMAWSLGIDPDSYSIWHSSQYPKGFNHNGYVNKEVDSLLEHGRRELDREKRAQIYGRMYEVIASEQPYYFLWYPKSIAGVSRRVGGLSEPGPAGIMLNIEDVFVTK